MPTPIENLTQNVNASTQQTVLQAVADDATARQQAADKASAINAIVDNADQQAVQNFFGGIAGDATAEDLLTGNNALIDKVSEDVDAIETLNASESAIRKILCRREGRDPANFADLDAVSADVSLVQALSLREESTNIIRDAVKAYTAISGNDRATREMMCHPVGLDATTFTNVAAVASDNAAMATIAADAQASRAMAAVPLAMQEVAASQTAMLEVAASQTAMQLVINSPTALQEVAGSQTAMQEVAASQTAMQEVTASQAAIQEVVSSQAAMQAVAASVTALDELSASQAMGTAVASSDIAVAAIEGASSNGNDSIPGTNSASIYIVELSGGGGGGADATGSDYGDAFSGGDSTTFNQTTAEGGGPGIFRTNDMPPTTGGFNVSSPDILIFGVEGGGAAGGEGDGGFEHDGGNGGLVKALIMNPQRNPLSLSIGGGGDGRAQGLDGQNGGATIFLPQAY